MPVCMRTEAKKMQKENIRFENCFLSLPNLLSIIYSFKMAALQLMHLECVYIDMSGLNE